MKIKSCYMLKMWALNSNPNHHVTQLLFTFEYTLDNNTLNSNSVSSIGIICS